MLELKEYQVDWLCQHMGHSMDVHKQYYRQNSDKVERMDIAKLLLLQEFNVAAKFKNMPLENIRIEGEPNLGIFG